MWVAHMNSETLDFGKSRWKNLGRSLGRCVQGPGEPECHRTGCQDSVGLVYKYLVKNVYTCGRIWSEACFHANLMRLASFSVRLSDKQHNTTAPERHLSAECAQVGSHLARCPRTECVNAHRTGQAVSPVTSWLTVGTGSLSDHLPSTLIWKLPGVITPEGSLPLMFLFPAPLISWNEEVQVQPSRSPDAVATTEASAWLITRLPFNMDSRL